MPVSTHLLERAYQLINANQLQNAELVLDAVVRVDPQNVEAWKTYLQIHQSQNDLDWLKERVLKTKELCEPDKNELVNYYNQLTQNLNDKKETVVRTHTFALPRHDKKEDSECLTCAVARCPRRAHVRRITARETTTQLELIDMYDYPVKIVNKETRTRPSQRDIYTTFVFDIAIAALKTMLRDPFGSKVTAHVQKTISLANDLIKNPKDAYARFSKWIHFEKSVGFSLLALFFMGVRLAVSNHVVGYVFLGISVIGSGGWLVNFGSHTTNQNRVYLHENKINLPVIKEGEIGRNPKLDKEKTEVIK